MGCLVCSSVNSIGINKEQGVSLSREWMNFEIQVSAHESRTSLSVLRNKVRKHALSKAHAQAVKVAEEQKEAAIENAMETMTESYMKKEEN
ncbi:E3 SUMO-protein ligase KIAA1586-like [Toxotes jaculatrix]|uniref:E3 SUMO-protein ligase KIAA1586-like n=1 Tax=Toxotes jaculatrix TaxID=941984 RepID=UPI001B3AC557|nr:E3 SUMO-protein ligase KIAA1586-like [Toxotes jaculatrix]